MAILLVCIMFTHEYMRYYEYTSISTHGTHFVLPAVPFKFIYLGELSRSAHTKCSHFRKLLLKCIHGEMHSNHKCAACITFAHRTCVWNQLPDQSRTCLASRASLSPLQSLLDLTGNSFICMTWGQSAVHSFSLLHGMHRTDIPLPGIHSTVEGHLGSSHFTPSWAVPLWMFQYQWCISLEIHPGVKLQGTCGVL